VDDLWVQKQPEVPKVGITPWVKKIGSGRFGVKWGTLGFFVNLQVGSCGAQINRGPGSKWLKARGTWSGLLHSFPAWVPNTAVLVDPSPGWGAKGPSPGGDNGKRPLGGAHTSSRGETPL